MRIAAMLLATATLTGCNVARTAIDVASVPVRAGAHAVGSVVPSQAEHDRNYGRRMRRDEAREGRERREWAKNCQRTPDDARCQHYDGFVAGAR